MNTTVQAVLDSFDALSEGDQYEVTVEVLRRVTRSAPAELSEEALLSLADDLFCELDEHESENARSTPR